MRHLKPTATNIVVERVVTNSTSIVGLDLSQVKDDHMFEIRVVTVGPDCTLGVQPEDLVEISEGSMALPLPGMSVADPVTGVRPEFFVIREKDIVGVWSWAV